MADKSSAAAAAAAASTASNGTNSTAPGAASHPASAVKPSLRQTIFRSFRGPQVAAPLASSATASPTSRPIDHHKPDYGSSSAVTDPVANPFDVDAATAAAASAVAEVELANAHEHNVPKTPAEQFRAHLVELIKPLPLSEPRRTETILNRCERLAAIGTATEMLDPPPPQGQVFRVAVTLLGGDDHAQYPLVIKEAACDVLAKAVKHSDEKASAAPLALRETRSGAPGSQSSKALDSDQPLATIDRALMYRMVKELSDDDSHSASSCKLPSKDDLSATSFPSLHAQLRALHALSRDGRDVASFDGIIPLLSRWLIIIWREVQALRQLHKYVKPTPQPEESTSDRSDSGPSSQPIDEHLYVEQLSAREWSLQAILHLMRSIFKFSFPQVTEQVEAALQSLALLVLTPLSRDLLVDDDSTPLRRSSTPGANLTNLQPLVSLTREASRSQSRDRRPRASSIEGYSYYGIEVANTPDSGSESSPMMTPQLGPRASGSLVAPMNLSTLAPSPSRRAPSQLSRLITVDNEDLPIFPDLQDMEVRAIIELLDTVLKYGYIPPTCVLPVSMLLCRILGYDSVAAAAKTPPKSLLPQTFTPWQQAVYPLLSNLLHSHSAYRAIRQVRELLLKQKAGDLTSPVGDRDEDAEVEDGAEDEAVLAGAVLFLRFTMTILANLARDGRGSKDPAIASRIEEDFLGPRLPLVLLIPALRGALLRQSDIVDLQVVSLVEALLLPTKPVVDGTGPPIPLLSKNRLRGEEWNELLQLTSVAKRHIEGWHFKAAGGGAEIRVPIVLQALVTLLAKLPLANPEQLHLSPAEAGTQPAPGGGLPPLTLPWTPKLSSLLLSLAPTLPTRLTLDLIKYHRAQRLCLPVNPDWIANLQRLLGAFMYGQVKLKVDSNTAPSSTFSNVTAAGPWQDKSRKALATLLLEDVYEAVVSFPAYRATLLREIILPTARMLLPHESDVEVDTKTREVLIQAASLSSAASVGAEGEGEDVFTAVRELFCKLARAPSTATSPSGSNAGHVHFADAPGSHDHRSKQGTTLAGKDDQNRAAEPSTAAGSSGSGPLPISKPMQSALNLISIFNQIAFSSPWVNFDNAESLLAEQEEKARTACIAIFRDLLSLVQPSTAAVTEVAANGHGSVETLTGSTTSSETRLAILQWFLRIRTDRHHRVFLIGYLDEQVEPSASIILKTPEAKAAAAAAEAATASGEKSRAARADGREGGRRQTMGGDSAAAVRSRSRAKDREPSRERERGRAERVSDTAAPRGANRSISASRGGAMAKKPAAEHQSLWQIPQILAFDMPTTSLRSDIVYTYIHDDDPSCSHHHQHKPGAMPLPLPVSDLLETYIKIMASEKDWELVSYVICHLPPQLSNKHLFCGPKAQIQVAALRQFLCSLILQQKLMEEVVLPDDIKRSDVYAVCYATLTTLLSYRALFSRSQLDEMVEAFISGLNKSQNTAQPCVRALSIAVYEAQKSVTRMLPSMLVKLSTIMSHMTMSVHILELIASIGQVPACYANFTDAEYRRVFGIALQYIQYHQAHSVATASSAAGNRAKEDFRADPSSFTLSQYVMMLAYYNISIWFMTLRLGEREKHVSSIIRGLQLANEGRDQVADQSEVCFDFLARFTHSNADPKPKRSFLNSVVMGDRSGNGSAVAPVSSNGRGLNSGKDTGRVSKTWLVGKGLITITSLRKEGWMEIVIRRASGTIAMVSKLENVPISVLPDEDGERQDLPAALMMDRNPRTAALAVLRAPKMRQRGIRVPMLEDAEQEMDNRRRLAPGQEAAEVLGEGERLRSREVMGPAHFGLASRPRGASFSGPVSEDTVNLSRSKDVNPYELSGPDADQQQTGSLPSIDSDEDAIEKVLTSVLSEGGKLRQQKEEQSNQAKATNGSGEPALVHQPPAKQSVIREPAIDPSTIALQFSSYPDSKEQPILLPDEPATARLIKAIDLTPVVDLHKIGCLYVGPGQKDEVEILGNRHGSPGYVRFLAGLGDLITLKGQEDVYTGGLDRENDIHGKYAYAWSDDIAQIVFHSATMMPNRPEDPRHSSKKALIGNDWVHVVFNESGSEYVFGTIPSQFNYVNIVISPTTKGGTNLGSVSPLDTTFYRVSLQRRTGLPSFSPVGDGQLISAGSLPIFVRSLALNANVLSQIYNDTGESMQPYSSNWCNRLNHVVRYKNQWEVKRRRRLEEEGVTEEEGATVDGKDFTSFT